MASKNSFRRKALRIAAPVTLQSMLQASFGIVDQIMIGQLGSVSVAGVGLAGRFSSMFSVLASAVGTGAGIMLSQYMGQGNRRGLRRSFWVNLGVAGAMAGVFMLLCGLLPEQIMGLYTQDEAAIAVAADYLRIVAFGFLPAAGTTLLSALFRCMERATLPLWSGIFAALLNTGLNEVLIFGRMGLPEMGAQGAALATLISQCAGFLLMLLLFLRRRAVLAADPKEVRSPFCWKQYAALLLPLIACEWMWSLGENVYAAIYGRLGTQSCAAMTLTNPVQSLLIGAMCGLSQAAGVIVGKRLGRGERDGAYDAARRLMRYGLVGVLGLSAVLVLLRGAYVNIYRVEAEVRALAEQILLVYALIVPFKVLNMILGGGILRSGGRTQISMAIDLIGTWLLGVPAGLLAAFALRLSIQYVYLLLSLEECVRLGISLAVFRRRRWMQVLKG